MTKKIAQLQEIYNEHILEWKSYLANISKEISRHLEKAEIQFSLKSRIKTIESLNKKKDLLQKNDRMGDGTIKDLLGLRVIVPFQEDVEHVIDLLQENFHIVETERKSENLSYREFAYDSVHLLSSLGDEDNVVFPRQCKKVCEIQVRTILQEAWAEVEHELIYKSNVRLPNELIRKKLAALNATLSLSDIIFQEIRDYQKKMERWGQERFQDLKRQALLIEVGDVPKYFRKRSQISVSGTAHKKLESIFMQALAAHNKKDHKKAIGLYTKALNMDPDLKIRSIIYNHRGMAKFMLRMERQALEDFSLSFQCDSKNYRALNNRALVLRRMGRVREALEDFNHSVALNENQSEVYFLRAQTNFEIEEYQNSLNDLKIALKLQPKYKEAKNLMTHVKEAITREQEY